jgi:hypothetical protein
MISGQKVKYIGLGSNYGKKGEFDRYTNKAKTKCRFSLERGDGSLSGYVGLVKDLEPLK